MPSCVTPTSSWISPVYVVCGRCFFVYMDDIRWRSNWSIPKWHTHAYGLSMHPPQKLVWLSTQSWPSWCNAQTPVCSFPSRSPLTKLSNWSRDGARPTAASCASPSGSASKALRIMSCWGSDIVLNTFGIPPMFQGAPYLTPSVICDQIRFLPVSPDEGPPSANLLSYGHRQRAPLQKMKLYLPDTPCVELQGLVGCLWPTASGKSNRVIQASYPWFHSVNRDSLSW